MYCRKCGKQISANQRFCRFCGGGVETIANVPSELSSLPDSGEQMSKVTNRMAPRRMNGKTISGLITIGLGVTVLVNAQGHVVGDWIGIAVFLMGVALAIYGAFSPVKAKELTSGQSAQPKTLDQPAADVTV